MIMGFYGENKWLSNFEKVDIKWLGKFYPSTENAYQASKSKTKKEATSFVKITPGQAQRLGQKIDVIEEWDEIKYDVMYTVNLLKFKNPILRGRLAATGDQVLIEGNWWHDNYWGACTCHECKDIPKQNNLGKILMSIRDRLS